MESRAALFGGPGNWPTRILIMVALRASVVENLGGVGTFQYQQPASRCIFLLARYSYRKKTEILDRKSDVTLPQNAIFSAAARRFNNSYV